jgi:DNA-binding NtrC family response regulator
LHSQLCPPVFRHLKIVNDALRKLIVIVDDEPSYAGLMAQLLTDGLECQVAAFTSPLDALAALPSLEVGAIVTDYSMPKLNGLEFVTQAEPLVPGTPFIVTSGHTVGLPVESFRRIAAVKALLQKPVGWRKLAEEILRVWPDPLNVPTLKPELASLI